MRFERSLATVLFTDIVGSTERAAELRDAAWRDLRHEHERRVRRELRRFGGHEISTAGDSFLATFTNPARAIACAAAIRQAVLELGLQIRSGLHMGELDREGDDLGGIGVHIGARVAAEAGPGEILVSGSLHDALAGSAFDFEDRGVHPLKGVPGEWRLYAVTSVPGEAGEALPVRWVQFPLTQRWVWLIVTVLAALLLGGVYLVQREPLPDLYPEEVLAADADPGIAVLPFTVNEPALAHWREGMVDLLSMNLDGVPALRAIDNRTVLARWEEIVADTARADLTTALAVARRTGARYAVLGSVVASGPNMRLVADLYDVHSGKTLGQGRVEGAPDSIFGLVDRLSIEILGVLLQERAEGLPEIRLASVTTGSVPALKAFLEGELLLREGDFANAVDAFQRALASDSTFALAAYRLSEAYGWSEGVGDLATGAIERAALLGDRLPDREKALVRGALALERGTLDGIDIMREVVRRHPDDAEAWYLLGDLYFHLGGQALVSPGESDRAFARASALDPRFAPAYLHRISTALRSAPDSARVTRLIEIYGQLAPGTRTLRNFRLVSALTFGDDAARVRAMAALDTTSAPLPFVAQDLSNARFLETKSEVLNMALDGAHPFLPSFAAQTLFGTLLFRGRLEEALAVSHHPAVVQRRGELLYEAHVRGFAVPDDQLSIALALASADTTDVFGVLYAGAFAAERGRWGDHGDALARLRSIERDAGQSADSTKARLAGGVALALEGVEAWRRDGRLGEARSALDQARTSVTGHFREGTANRIIRWWLGELLIQSGEPREAARYFGSLASGDAFVSDPVASYRLGQLHERLGEYREAREQYEYFLTAWRDPDPGLRSRREEGREALVRLEGSRRG